MNRQVTAKYPEHLEFFQALQPIALRNTFTFGDTCLKAEPLSAGELSG